jgi:hypothetical protein
VPPAQRPTAAVTTATVRTATGAPANVRSAPGRASPLAGSIPNGTAVQIVDQAVADGTQWFQVERGNSGGARKWIHGDSLQDATTQAVAPTLASDDASGADVTVGDLGGAAEIIGRLQAGDLGAGPGLLARIEDAAVKSAVLSFCRGVVSDEAKANVSGIQSWLARRGVVAFCQSELDAEAAAQAANVSGLGGVAPTDDNAARFRMLARQWAPIEAWDASANPGCPCKGLVAPYLEDWRAFQAEGVEPGPADAKAIDEQLAACRSAHAIVNQYSGGSLGAWALDEYATRRQAVRDAERGDLGGDCGGADPPGAVRTREEAYVWAGTLKPGERVSVAGRLGTVVGVSGTRCGAQSRKSVELRFDDGTYGPGFADKSVDVVDATLVDRLDPANVGGAGTVALVTGALALAAGAVYVATKGSADATTPAKDASPSAPVPAQAPKAVSPPSPEEIKKLAAKGVLAEMHGSVEAGAALAAGGVLGKPRGDELIQAGWTFTWSRLQARGASGPMMPPRAAPPPPPKPATQPAIPAVWPASAWQAAPTGADAIDALNKANAAQTAQAQADREFAALQETAKHDTQVSGLPAPPPFVLECKVQELAAAYDGVVTLAAKDPSCQAAVAPMLGRWRATLAGYRRGDPVDLTQVGADLAGFFDFVNPFAPSSEVKDKVDEVAKQWLVLEAQMAGDPKVARAVAPQHDHWKEFYAAWQNDDRRLDQVRGVVDDINVAKANAAGISRQQLQAQGGEVSTVDFSKLSAAQGAAVKVDDVAPKIPSLPSPGKTGPLTFAAIGAGITAAGLALIKLIR